MEINKKILTEFTLVKIKGKIDINSSDELKKGLEDVDTNKNIVLDFNDVEYITSAGLRILLLLRKRVAVSKISIVNVNNPIYEVFNTSGFDNYFEIKIRNDEEFDLGKECFVSILRSRVYNHGDKVVYVYAGREYTWRDIETGSHIVAYDLSKKGVRKGSHVGLCVVNSINWLFTFYAIQKLGAVAVLMNSNLKPRELAVLANVADVTCICYGEVPGFTVFSEYKDLIGQEQTPVKTVYNVSPSVNFLNRANEYEDIKEMFREERNFDDPSVIIFTSGSTGVPKAVLNSSYNIMQSLKELPFIAGFRSTDKSLAFLPCFHIFGFMINVVFGLMVNYTSYIPESSNVKALLSMIEKYGITNFCTVNTLLFRMIQLPEFDKEKVSTLKISVLAGAITNEAQLLLLQKNFTNCSFFNLYGMSEKPMISITRRNDTVDKATKTVGLPVGDVEIIVKDTAGNILPKGETGEIFVRSDSMILCYYKLDISKQPIDEDGFFATGDLGYVDEDGYVVLTGRAKDLIIRGGENISPGEIAGAISEYGNVAEVKVLGVPDKIMGEEICAVITVKSGEIFDEAEMRNGLAVKLARYKIPKYFIVYDKFPILDNGKIDQITLKKDVISRLKIATD